MSHTLVMDDKLVEHVNILRTAGMFLLGISGIKYLGKIWPYLCVYSVCIAVHRWLGCAKSAH
jgi:hypothetical protein